VQSTQSVYQMKVKVHGDIMIEEKEYGNPHKQGAKAIVDKQSSCGGRIILNNVLVHGNLIDFDYSVSHELKEFFAKDTHFFYEYLFDVDLTDVPKSILAVPFVMNLMPLIWLSNSTLVVDCLDKAFYESLEEIKKGFQRVYPKVSFEGQLLVETIEDNRYATTGKSTIFFTGGVDATASLINNLSENPEPFYILGADVNLSDVENIEAAQRDVSHILKGFGLKGKFIKSSIRFFYDGVRITNAFESKLHDSWWHGAQHSIGMLSLMAPYAYLMHIDTCILAASFTKEGEGKINCVSFPFIDNALCFGSTHCYHDGYEMTRQDKINLIADYVSKNKLTIQLRVCFSPHNGENCNACEKCLRTILSLTAAGANPNHFGFRVNHQVYMQAHEYLSTHLLYHTAHWKAIRSEFRKNKKKWKDNPDVSWILDIQFNNIHIYWRIIKNKLKRLLKK